MSRIILVCTLLLASLVNAAPALAGPTSQSGRINNIAFSGDAVYIMLDSGVPDNCSGTPFGWMMIRAADKPIVALALGLWLRGDAAQALVAVHTTGIDSSGYCQVDHIIPAN